MAASSPGDLEWLLERARLAARRAYAPYSGYAVGCALRCGGDGAIFLGCNVENASYGLSLCAERVAASSAVAAGRHDFDAIAVWAEGPELPYPCGACRQFLVEFGAGLAVVVGNGSSSRAVPLEELLPHPFLPSSMAGARTGKPGRAGGKVAFCQLCGAELELPHPPAPFPEGRV